MNKMRAKKAHLPYDDHERALKLLHALDQRVWEVKVSAIIESPNYETLVVDELFSKPKSIEIDNQTQAKIKNPGAPTMALVSRGGSASNPSPPMFAISSLLSIMEELVESLGDEELALLASWFTRFHNKHMSRRHGGSKDGCYNYGDPNHFIFSCPRRESKRLARSTTTLVGATASGSTPPESTSPRDDSARRRSRRSTFRRQRSRSMPSSPPSVTLTMTSMTPHLPRATRRLRGGSRTS
jgi:hypothetical protein